MVFGTSITAILAVPDVKETAEYYRDRLGFSITFLWGNPPTYGAVDVGGCQVNFIKSESASGEAGDRGGIYVGTSAVDEAYERLAAQGVQCLSALGDREYGMRDFVALDLNGYRVCFGKPTVE